MLFGTPKIGIAATHARRHHVHLASHEWASNTDMREVARKHLDEHGPKDPTTILLVTVHEHAGWWLTFARVDGEVQVVGSANDRAEYSLAIDAVRTLVRALPTRVELRTEWRRPERVITG